MANYCQGTAPIAQNIQDQGVHQQGQDINMASPPSYLNDPFNPIHYPQLAQELTLEDVFGDQPVDLTTPLDISYFSNPAVLEIYKPINEIANLQEAIDAASAVFDANNGRCLRAINGRRNAKYCITHLENRPRLEMEIEILRRKAIGYGTCATDFAWMPKETLKRCDRCVERERIRKENRAAAAAAAAGQAAQQAQEGESNSEQPTNDSIMSGQENAGL
ncbi:hypothetical protein N0V85_009552 [Neurospora sp. IMI 360204]|nr:hypothetical protein N0V85_009552 [Neurospora sp. IMI 360204]